MRKYGLALGILDNEWGRVYRSSLMCDSGAIKHPEWGLEETEADRVMRCVERLIWAELRLSQRIKKLNPQQEEEFLCKYLLPREVLAP